jgi:hypothetical protein
MKTPYLTKHSDSAERPGLRPRASLLSWVRRQVGTAKSLFLALSCAAALPSTVSASDIALPGRGYGLFVQFYPNVSSAYPASSYNASGSWSTLVGSVRADVLAEQARQAGASYVILSLGWTNGFFCAPNAEYERLNGMQNGRYTSARDLPLDLGRELRSRGLKLFLYLAAEGPVAPVLSPGINNPANTTMAGSGWGNTDFRIRYFNMIREWSERYGSVANNDLVEGWYIDGCDAIGKGVGVENEGPLADDLARALLAGNGNAMICLSPQTARRFDRLSSFCDWMPGENYGFYGVPPSVGARVNGMRWHEFSYLGEDIGPVTNIGSGWANPTNSRYSGAQLGAYLKIVTDRGARATVAVSINPTSGILANQNAALVEAKRIMDTGNIDQTDLAKFKPVEFRARDPQTDDRSQTLSINSYYKFPNYAVDGVNGKLAMAGGGSDGNYCVQVDLCADKTVRAFSVKMGDVDFCDTYSIDYFSNSTNRWESLIQRNYVPGEVFSLGAAVTGRFFMIRTLYTRPGKTMGVDSFEIYANPPGGTPVSAQPSDGRYRIINRNSGFSLSVYTDNVISGQLLTQWNWYGGDNQSWFLQNRGNNQYSIIVQRNSTTANLCIDVPGASTTLGRQVTLYNYLGGTNQRWTFRATNSGYFTLSPVHDAGKALSVTGNSVVLNDAAKIMVTTNSSGVGQQWRLERLP